jgi:hypothetical protein
MSILSGLFGNDSDSASSNDSMLDIDGGLSLVATTESYDKSVDDDGSWDESYDTSSIGTSLDFGSILDSMNQSVSETDGDGLFG